jgi:hypothetical protein
MEGICSVLFPVACGGGDDYIFKSPFLCMFENKLDLNILLASLSSSLYLIEAKRDMSC